jgi:hypothetical protein
MGRIGISPRYLLNSLLFIGEFKHELRESQSQSVNLIIGKPKKTS